MYTKKDEIEARNAVFIGAYFIIRGLSLLVGGYPNEAQTLTQLMNGNFEFSGYVYLYFLLLIALYFTGNWVQHKNDPQILNEKPDEE